MGNVIESRAKHRGHKRILVPYDGSSFSEKALTEALSIAKAYESTIFLVNVVDISSVTPPGKIHSRHLRTFKQIQNSVKSTAESTLQRIKKECKKEGINVENVVLKGSTADKLLRFAKQNKIDLIVIGSKGLSGLSKIMALGSVSRKISELSICPVMIVR